MRLQRKSKAKQRWRTTAASIFVGFEMTILGTITRDARAVATAATAAVRFLACGRGIVAVVVGVVVIVLVVLQIDVVEDYSKECSAYAKNGLLDPSQHRSRKPAMLNHDDCLVDFAGNNRRVADAKNWRRIEEHDVVAFLQLGDGVRHPLRIKNANGVRRQNAAGQNRQVFYTRWHDHLFEVHIGREIIR